MMLFLPSTEWEEGDRRKGAEGQRGMKKLVNNEEVAELEFRSNQSDCQSP